jgi:hypothetical protein
VREPGGPRVVARSDGKRHNHGYEDLGHGVVEIGEVVGEFQDVAVDEALEAPATATRK